VVMLEALEHAAQHDVLGVVGAFVFGDEGLVREHEAEVPTLPCHSLVWANEAVGDASDRALVGLGGAFFVEVNIQGQKKAALRWRCNLCFELDKLHG